MGEYGRVLPPTHNTAPAGGNSRYAQYRNSRRQYTQKLPNLLKSSQYFPQKPPTILLPAYAENFGIRYTVVWQTPACRAIELGRFGRVWEVLGSGQSPLQPADAPLRRETRRVMPAAYAQYRNSRRYDKPVIYRYLPLYSVQPPTISAVSVPLTA